MQEGERVPQKNEGGWHFALKDSEDDLHLLLDVKLGNGILTSDVKADVQPRLLRVLAKVCSRWSPSILWHTMPHSALLLLEFDTP